MIGFERYVSERSVALQRFAYLVCHNVDDARDLVQDALLGLYPRWTKVCAGGNPAGEARNGAIRGSSRRSCAATGS